jgi:hypothetical protein
LKVVCRGEIVEVGFSRGYFGAMGWSD